MWIMVAAAEVGMQPQLVCSNESRATAGLSEDRGAESPEQAQGWANRRPLPRPGGWGGKERKVSTRPREANSFQS